MPLTSFADDVAAVRRVVALMGGPTLLVGHSYGGAVITEAGNDPNVAALAYVAAFAPAEGDIGPALQGAAGPGTAIIEPDADGFLWLNKEKYAANFAQDVEPSQARIMAAVQRPVNGQIYATAKIQTAAWREKPVFYLVAENDQMISPTAERQFAERMKAVVRSVPSSHVAMVSQPEATAAFIAEAANK
jgi:pimeloyl-ACP methyl ester carboxylesterase